MGDPPAYCLCNGSAGSLCRSRRLRRSRPARSKCRRIVTRSPKRPSADPLPSSVTSMPTPPLICAGWGGAKGLSACARNEEVISQMDTAGGSAAAAAVLGRWGRTHPEPTLRRMGPTQTSPSGIIASPAERNHARPHALSGQPKIEPQQYSALEGWSKTVRADEGWLSPSVNPLRPCSSGSATLHGVDAAPAACRAASGPFRSLGREPRAGHGPSACG